MSKGKWMPGGKPIIPSGRNYYKLFNCEPCDRSFTKISYYEKHLTTELHFKRTSRQTCRDYSSDPDFFEQVRTQRSCRVQKSRSQKNAEDDDDDTQTNKKKKSPVKLDTHNHNQIHCPTCFSSVEKPRMGKHLVSHYHCQKTSSKDRYLNPERSLILDNIHDIVVEAPFQCFPCKYYFTQRDQLLNHFLKTHIKLKIKAQRSSDKNMRLSGWNCSACRYLLASDGQAMFEHLMSPMHLKMEATIGKSIPIILKEVVIQACPHCEKKFMLTRELLSHMKKKHEEAHQSASSTEEPMKIEIGEVEIFTNPLPAIAIGEIPFEIIDDFVNSSSISTMLDVPDPDPWPSPSPCQILPPPPAPANDQVLTFTCEFCPKIFASAASRQRHAGKAHPLLGDYKCDLCDYTTKKRSHILRHTATHKSDREKKFICGECGASFFLISALNYHKKIHIGKTLHCTYPQCTFTGRSKSDISAHTATVHVTKGTAGSNFSCDQCSYIAKTKKCLKRHLLLLHESTESGQIQTFQCQHCFFNTKLASSLKRHQLQHLDQRPFQCPHCDYATRSIANLRCHVLMRAVHPGKSLYYCRICLKAGIGVDEIFKTNKFGDFQAHVTRNHQDHRDSRSRAGLMAIAGIGISDQKTSSSMDLPKLPQDKLEGKIQTRKTAKIIPNTQKSTTGESSPPGKQQPKVEIERRSRKSLRNVVTIAMDDGLGNGEILEADGCDSLTCFGDKDNSFIMSVLASPDQFDDIFGEPGPGGTERDTVLDFTKL